MFTDCSITDLEKSRVQYTVQYLYCSYTVINYDGKVFVLLIFTVTEA